MNIIQIIPGSGGSFYCGNCLRDAKYFDALRKQQHDVVKIPMYLPLFSDEHDLNEIPVFYGAVSIYLKQLFPLLRKTPRWVDRLLNSKPILKLAASQAGSTNAKGLEEMTVSMLKGEKGKQKEELEVMVEWLANHYKADVIHLSNALLLGLARRLKEKLNVAIACSLQDEDVWVDIMKPEISEYVWKLMEERAKHVDLFISVSDYFSDVARKKMNLPREKIKTVHLGIEPTEYEYINSSEKQKNIGFISRMSHENGLDILVDAFIELKKDSQNSDVKLVITGGSTGDDSKFLKNLRKKIQRHNLSRFVEWHEEFEGKPRHDFFRKVQLISVPVRKGEAFGIYLIEAMVSGIPVVQPDLGAFPEIVSKGGGGIIYNENTPLRLAKALQDLLDDQQKTGQLSKNARKSVETNFDINAQAQELIEIYSLMTKK